MDALWYRNLLLFCLWPHIAFISLGRQTSLSTVRREDTAHLFVWLDEFGDEAGETVDGVELHPFVETMDCIRSALYGINSC